MTTAPLACITVYFSNGSDANYPWWVSLKEGRAMSETFGHFQSANRAIAYAVTLSWRLKIPLLVPDWLIPLAGRIQSLLTAPPDPNDFDGMLTLVRLDLSPCVKMDTATLDAIENEWIGDDFCRYPFLY